MVAITAKLAEELDDKLTGYLSRDGRLGLPHRYLKGDHDKAYMPKGAKGEYADIAAKAVTNWLPLVPDEFNKGLAVDGFRARLANENAPHWRHWQENGLDARQTIAHRGALEYGTSYVLVLPAVGNAGRAYIRPLSPLKSAAWYTDDDDEFPTVAIHRMGVETDSFGNSDHLLGVYNDKERRIFTRRDGTGTATWRKTELHYLGVTPFVRFRTQLGGESEGLVRPFKLHQDRINEVVFNILIAMQYASFRQRWATGLVIPTIEDEDDPNYGKPVEPFEAAVNRLWVSDSPDTKFGDFAQTDVNGHQQEYKSAVNTLAAAAQISPAVLTGDLINVGQDAILSLKSGFFRKLGEYQLLFGEAWESVFTLAAKAAKDAAPDASSEVRWRDTSGAQMKAAVESLALLSTLGVPNEALWEDVPGMTDAKLQRWREAVKADPLDTLTAELARQTAAPAAPVAPDPAIPTAA